MQTPKHVLKHIKYIYFIFFAILFFTMQNFLYLCGRKIPLLLIPTAKENIFQKLTELLTLKKSKVMAD